jgi:glucosamine--fructose-6-phosphate aminotransferase (isomerizing)
MCGIAGYAGLERPAAEFVTEALQELEYRGYDSFGYVVNNHRGYEAVRKVGAPSESFACKCPEAYPGKLCIGHTRWATHGEVCIKNTHPIIGGTLELPVYVVHNGVIDNYKNLKQRLIAEGFEFRTTTDTEVLAHIFDYLASLRRYEEDKVFAAQAILTEILILCEGRYAFAIISEHFPNMLLIACNGCPLVFTEEGHLASDCEAFCGVSDKYYRLNSQQVAVKEVDKPGWHVRTKDLVEVKLTAKPVPSAEEEISQEGNHHRMLHEIREQPAILRKEPLKAIFLPHCARMVFLGCGSSWHAGMLGQYFVERYANLPAEVHYASEFIYHNPKLLSANDLYVAISQSGETGDTVAALQMLNERFGCKANIVLITNKPESTAAQYAQNIFILPAGNEFGVASTKTFTATCACLVDIAYAVETWNQPPRDHPPKFRRSLANAVQKVLDREKEIEEIGRYVAGFLNVLCLGHSLNYPIALEGALKLKEVAYIHAEGMPAAEMKHGPLALIDGGTLSIFVLAESENPPPARLFSNMQEVKARGGAVVAICDKSLADPVSELADKVFILPHVVEHNQPIVASVVLQLISYYAAVERGLPVDRPRNLAKCVTVA